MRKIVAVFMAVCVLSTSAFSATHEELTDVQSELQQAAESDAASKGSQCLPLYRQYKRGLLLKALLVPPIGLPVTYGLTYAAIAGGTQYGVGSAAGAQAWVNGFAYGIVYGGVVFTAAAGALIYLETDAIVRLVKAGKMKNLIEDAYLYGKTDTKKLDRFIERLYRRYPALGHTTAPQDIAQQIVKWDQSGELCNGTLKTIKSPNARKLKRLLVKPTELEAALAKAF